MKKTLNSFFIVSVLLGSGIYLCDKLGIQLPTWIRFYFNDFLIVPIILITCLKILRWSKSNSLFTISFMQILYLCVFYSVLFEYFLPKYLVRYTSDVLDIVMYFTGGFVFYVLQKKNVAT